MYINITPGNVLNNKFIAICRSLFISFDDMPNAHIRVCYCISERDSECSFSFDILLNLELFLFLVVVMVCRDRLSNESTAL